jgi:hypothetical protein
MKQTLADTLGKLVGREMSSVTFVRDCVQLGFDGPGLNAYTLPTVSCGSEPLSFGQPGYRDTLCKQIGRRVERTQVDDHRVSIIFKNQAAVSISLKHDDYRGSEALEFSLDQNDCSWVV